MLNQFRRHFPQGSLVSELLAIDHGKYVVRVLIEVEGIILASGLAAADTVEAAEDKARNRALELLNWDKTESSPSQKPSGENISPPAEKVKEESKPTAPPIKAKPPVIPTPTKKDQEPSESVASTSPPREEITPQVTPETTPQLFSLENDYVGMENGNLQEMPQEEESLSSPPVEIEQIPESTTSETPSTNVESLDFSDIIARTDLELKRLNWTQEQGRDYLLATYGKKSRLHLSDEELLEFLHYLESQT